MGKGMTLGKGAQIMYTHVSKWKYVPIVTVPGIRKGGYERAADGVNLSMIYLIHCKNFLNIPVYPHTAQQY
jgi:hypothetical protein